MSPAEDDHLEHHVPAHRPADFARGVDEIRRRLPEIAVGPVGDRETWDQRLTEYREILAWLPELAADSDMRKPEWDRVNSLSGAGLQVLQESEPSLRAGAGGAHASLTRQLEELLERLEPLKQSATDTIWSTPEGEPPGVDQRPDVGSPPPETGDRATELPAP